MLGLELKKEKELCEHAADLTGILAYVASRRAAVRQPVGPYKIEKISY